MRIFPTGAPGFLGAEIARELCARGHECVAVARSPTEKIVGGDLVSPQFGRLPYRPHHVMRLEGKLNHIRTIAGWSPTISIEDGFAEIVAACYRMEKAA